MVDFQGLGEGALLPPGFHPYEGPWRVIPEADGANGQERMILPWAVLVVAGKGRCYADGTASVRFLPVSGVADASGGIIFRAQDPGVPNPAWQLRNGDPGMNGHRSLVACPQPSRG